MNFVTVTEKPSSPNQYYCPHDRYLILFKKILRFNSTVEQITAVGSEPELYYYYFSGFQSIKIMILHRSTPGSAGSREKMHPRYSCVRALLTRSRSDKFTSRR